MSTRGIRSRQRPAGAVVAEPLEADDVVLVEPGVGVEREALDERTPATGAAGGRARPPWHLDAFELEDVQRSLGRRLVREHPSRVQKAEDTAGDALSNPGAQATLAFPEPGKVAGRGSCNRFTGPAEIGDLGVVKFGPLASTKMACIDEAVSAQETKYLDALNKGERIALDGDTLLVYSQGLEKPLHFSRDKK